MRILTIIGARPQFIKAATLSRIFKKYNDIEEVIVHTGQHFDQNMSQVFFDEMDIPLPKYNLEISSLEHGAMTGRMLEGIESVILKESPDLVLVYGDTNSTLAGALAAKKQQVKVAHIEAGLRSFNMSMPEEINRILTDRISDYLFCPTQTAVDNLLKEGFNNIPCKVFKPGDVMQDAALFYGSKTLENISELESVRGSFILTTLHRAENTNDKGRLSLFVEALNYIHENVCEVILPLHPRTKLKLSEFNLNLQVSIIEPVGYLEMIKLIHTSELVLTDSGGLQKEAYFFRKHCVTLREETEWIELVEAEVNILTGANVDLIINAVTEMMTKESDFSQNLYGNGEAAQNIVNQLLENK